MSEGTSGVFGVDVTDCGPFVVGAVPGLGPLEAGGGIVCGVVTEIPLSLGVVADIGLVLAND